MQLKHRGDTRWITVSSSIKGKAIQNEPEIVITCSNGFGVLGTGESSGHQEDKIT